MKKRLIDCTARELAAYTKEDLLRAIAESEGRVLATETIGTVTPMLVNITNAEFVASLGSDLIMLNIFDVNHPIIQGLPDVAPEDTIREIKRLTGKMVAINLEPVAYVPKSSQEEESVWDLTSGLCHAGKCPRPKRKPGCALAGRLSPTQRCRLLQNHRGTLERAAYRHQL